MPSRTGRSARLRILTGSSPTGSQYLHALGCATAKSYVAPDSHEITLVTSGEGPPVKASSGTMHERACIDRAPLVVLIQDNGYAISVPVEKQTAGGNIVNLLAGFPRLRCAGSGWYQLCGILPRDVAGGGTRAGREGASFSEGGCDSPLLAFAFR